MAHLAEGTMRRMVDDPDARAASDARHLDECADCKARYDAVAADAAAVTRLLAVPDARFDVAHAFERMRTAPAVRPRFGFRLPVLPATSRPMRLALAGVIAVAALIALVAAQNLNLFYSPSTVTPVPVTVADMQSLSELSAYGTVTWTTPPQLQIATSAADAEHISGLQAPVVATLPSGVSSTVTYAAMPQAVAVFTFDAAKAAQAAAATGKTLPRLPAGMDGAKLTVTVGPAVGEIYGNFNGNAGSSNGATSSSTSKGVSDLALPQLVIGKSAVPTATSTQVSVKQLESYVLSLPGISPSLKAAIKAIGDPSTTLPIPVPVQFASSTAVQVQGVRGLALGDNTGLGSGVVWVKHGTVFAIAGTIKQTDAIQIANNLK